MTDQHKSGHQGGNSRGDYRGPRQGARPNGGRDGRRNDRGEGGFRKRDDNRGGKPYGNRDRKPYGDRNRSDKPYGDRDRKPYGNRDHGGKPYGDRDRKPYGDRSDARKGGPRDGKPYKKYNGGDSRRGGKPYGERGGKPYAKKRFDGDRRVFEDKRPRPEVAEGAAVAEETAAVAAGEEAQAGEEQVAEGEAPQRPYNRDNRRGERPYRDGGKPRGEKPFNKPFKPRLSPGRAAACAIGRVVRERDAFTAEVTPSVLATFTGISPEDAAFATKIARGVTATLGTLDEFIDRNLKSPDDIGPEVRDALRVSAYELLFLGKDDYAAVDQGVELVRSVAPKASGLANAVLRKMAKSAKKFPYGNPDLSLQVLARSQAFPLWLAKRLMNEMGLKQATAFMRACNTDAPVYIAVNAIKAEDADVIEVFDQAGSLMKKSETVPGCYLVEDARVLRKPEVRALFENGSVCVSDESAQAIAALACPDEDIEAFLEIGAGRGTKTILLQSDAVRAFGRTIPMVSVDDHAFKGELLAKRAAAYGINSVRPLTADARKLSETLPEASFDAVFVDAPCTGVGTLRRHPEIRWRLTAEQIEDMAAVEYDMLVEAAKMVKVGGVLTYATCTVFAEENERVVEKFRRTKFGETFEIEKTLATTLSASGCDAHFAVRMRRVR